MVLGHVMTRPKTKLCVIPCPCRVASLILLLAVLFDPAQPIAHLVIGTPTP